MQYLSIQSEDIKLNNTIPVSVLSYAIRCIEATKTAEGNALEVTFEKQRLSISGGGEVNDISYLLIGLDLIDPYVEAGSSISIETERWETTVVLSNPVLRSVESL